MLNLRLAPTVSRITLPELTFTSKYALRVICQFMLNVRLDAGGKPSTWFPPGGHVEHILK